MERDDGFNRRQFLATGAVGAVALATSREAMAQGQKFHVKPVPAEIFIDHGLNQETRLETLRGYLTPWNAQGYGYNVPVPHPVKVS